MNASPSLSTKFSTHIVSHRTNLLDRLDQTLCGYAKRPTPIFQVLGFVHVDQCRVRGAALEFSNIHRLCLFRRSMRPHEASRVVAASFAVDTSIMARLADGPFRLDQGAYRCRSQRTKAASVSGMTGVTSFHRSMPGNKGVKATMSS